jgi:hypothetical protein
MLALIALVCRKNASLPSHSQHTLSMRSVIIPAIVAAVVAYLVSFFCVDGLTNDKIVSLRAEVARLRAQVEKGQPAAPTTVQPPPVQTPAKVSTAEAPQPPPSRERTQSISVREEKE